jgi:hypothetical protein
MMAGWREVWTATHGRARRYHVVANNGMAACRPNNRLDGGGIPLGRLTRAADVPVHMRCQRNGCRQRWRTP